MRLAHNSLAHMTNNHLSNTNYRLEKAMQKLSSGYKINKASDDPTGQSISQRMRAQIRGLEKATDNASDGISLIQAGEGAFNEIHAILARMRELAVKAANETYAEDDKDSMQSEIAQLQQEIDRIAETTDFNGRKLLNGELNKKAYVDAGARFALSIVEIGGDIEPDDYGLTITADATQAIVPNLSTAQPTGYVITAAEEGNIYLNGLLIRASEGDTIDDIFIKMRDSFAKMGVDLSGHLGDYTLTTTAYGASERIELTASNPLLSTLFGLDGLAIEYGTDVEAEFSLDGGGDRIGFRDSATIRTDGNKITITDAYGFNMVYEAIPDAIATAGTSVDATITVLSAGPMVLQIGNNEGQTLNVNIAKTNIYSLGIDRINLYTNEFASQAIDKVDDAIKKISEIRSGLGAYQNRLEYTTTNLETAGENLTSAFARIKDTNMAETITEYTQQQILSQSAVQMLTKANFMPESILQLLQR